MITAKPFVFLVYSVASAIAASSLVAAEADPVNDALETPAVAVLIPFEGQIDPFSEHAFYRKLEEAQSLGADLIVVEINSPGGLVSSSQALAERLQSCSAETVAFIPAGADAISGAAMMSLGCDRIVIAERARIGDVGPIIQGSDSMFRHAPEKVVSLLAQVMRDLAEERGRPPAVAEAMVDRDLLVYRVTHKTSGEVRYLSEPEIEELKDRDDWEQGAPLRESEEGRFLTLNGQRAVEVGLAESLGESRRQLAEQYGINESDFQVLETNWVDNTVMILTWWPVTGLLVIIGLIALFMELMSPGIGVGALISGLCCALFFWSRFLGGTSGWLEVTLFCAGVVFISVEIFVLPGFGFSGVIGGLLMFTSFVMASQRFEMSDGVSVNATLQSMLILIVGVVVAFIAISAMGKHLSSIPMLRHFTLEPPSPSDVAVDRPAVDSIGGEELSLAVGDEGIADSTLRPAGRAKFGETYIDVVADGSFVDEGQKIQIVNINGHRIMVRAVAT